MLPDIRYKIKQKLEVGAHLEESDVLYILIQARKIMEITGNNSTLLFYCNWVAHSKIDRNSTFINEFKEKLKRINASNGVGVTAVFGFLSFKDFRNSFIGFIKQQVDDGLVLNLETLKNLEIKLRLIIEDIKIETKIEDKDVTIFFNKKGELVINNLPNQPPNIKLSLINAN